MYEYSAEVTKVVDGDTFDANVDLGFNTFAKLRFRLQNFDAPELSSSKELERKHASEAKLFVENLILNKQILLKSSKGKIREAVYNRWEAAVILPSGADLATILKQNGFTKKPTY